MDVVVLPTGLVSLEDRDPGTDDVNRLSRTRGRDYAPPSRERSRERSVPKDVTLRRTTRNGGMNKVRVLVPLDNSVRSHATQYRLLGK